MKWRNLRAKELHNLVRKLDLEATKRKRRSPHPIFWYYLDGKREIRIKLPNVHGGSGSLSTGFIKGIQNSLRLKTDQFEDLVECPLSAEEFEALIRKQLAGRL